MSVQCLALLVIASTVDYYSKVAGSLSFTIDETNNQTLSSAPHMLTQGFQQPFELNLINVKTIIQGNNKGSHQMNEVLYNEDVYANPSDIADSITFEWHDPTAPYTLAFQTKSTIKQSGSINIKGLGVVEQPHYLELKHCNCIEPWTASPVVLQSNTTYDFSLAASPAYTRNQFLSIERRMGLV